MRKTSTLIDLKASLSLQNHLDMARQGQYRAAGNLRSAEESTERYTSPEGNLAQVVVESQESRLSPHIQLSARERIVPISDSFLSCSVYPGTVREILQLESVRYVEDKKESVPHLDTVQSNVRLVDKESRRLVEEDGSGVVIGIVDSGFDLSHPAFRVGDRLRVECLLDQQNNHRAYSASELEGRWPARLGPLDEDGHGTHVASIAGGSRFLTYEGIAPGATFIFVRTNYEDIDEAIKWIFDKAGDRACVINLSMGNHFGAHDGTSVLEREIEKLTGPGRIVVASAGNDREREHHIGGWFHNGEHRSAYFDLFRNSAGKSEASISIWHEAADGFRMGIVPPAGGFLAFPDWNTRDDYETSFSSLRLGRKMHGPFPDAGRPSAFGTVHSQLEVKIQSSARDQEFLNWGLVIECERATLGRLDGWFGLSEVGRFKDRAGQLVDRSRTIAMPATARSVIAVGSHVARTSWASDEGEQRDETAVPGRTSTFSGEGPSRDGRPKPDVSAPGQYVTAALASKCRMDSWGERVSTGDRALTLEGTSMSAPVVTGLVALLLQRKKSLTPGNVTALLEQSASRDAHTGYGVWSGTYGYGKLDIRAALDLL